MTLRAVGRVQVPLVALTLALLAVPCASQPAPDQGPPREVRDTAQAGLRAMLGAGGGGGLQRLGFANADDAAGAGIGEGFRTYTVPPDRLLDGRETELRALAVPTTNWQLIVFNGGSPRAVITVDRVKGAWTAVSIGAAGLAAQSAALLDRWPASTYRLRFIRVYQASADLMEIAEGGAVIGYVPFLSARVALGAPGPFDAENLWSGEEVLARLRPVVRAAIGRQ